MAALVAGPVVLAMIGCLVAAAGNQRDLVWRSNAFANQSVPVSPRGLACQLHVDPAETFNGVRFAVAGAGGRPGPKVVVTIKRRYRALSRGTLAPGYRGQARRLVKLDKPVRGRSGLKVCFFNRGRRTLLLYGTSTSARGPEVTIGGKPKILGLQIDLTRKPRSALSMVGTIVHRASLQRPSPVGPWLFWVLGIAIVVGAPLLLVGAVRSVAAGDS